MIEKLLNKLGYMKKPKFNRCHKVRLKDLNGVFNILDIRVYIDYSTIRYFPKFIYKLHNQKYGVIHATEKDMERVK